MSKSMGNAIGITEPPGEMYGKLMSISDDLMRRYFELLAPAEWRRVADEVGGGGLHPMEAKKLLARTLVADFHGVVAADAAQRDFEQRFQQRVLPDELPEFVWSEPMPSEIHVPNLLRSCGLVASAGEARRLIAQRAVRVDGERVEELVLPLAPGTERLVLQVGSRRAMVVIFSRKPS